MISAGVADVRGRGEGELERTGLRETVVRMKMSLNDGKSPVTPRKVIEIRV